MQPSDLELYTTRELIEELMRRKTFLGVVIHAEEEFREEQWRGDKVFRVHHNANLRRDEAGRLLDVIAGHLDRQDA
jgi:hypothetical protein